MRLILDRLTEPSSHAGLAALTQAAKFILPGWAPVIDALTALLAALAVALPERR